MSSNVFFGSIGIFYKYKQGSITKYRERSGTYELLKSSILVAFSGALRIHLAFLLLQIQSSIPTCIAGGLIIYTVYTVDRALGSEEDTINRKELSSSKKEVGLIVSMCTFLIGTFILAKQGMFALALIPFVTGYLYSKGIKIGKYTLKLKGGLGVKNFVVGFTWGTFIAGLAGSNYGNPIPIFLIFIFFGIKLFVSSAIYDFKDIKGDTLAGINTLPISLGVKNTRNLLGGMHMMSHMLLGIALINGVIAFEPLIILYSFVCGLMCIQKCTQPDDENVPSRKFERIILVDGESTSIVGLRMFANILFN